MPLVGAGSEDALGDSRSYACAVRSVLTVDDAEIDGELIPQASQTLLHRPAPRDAEHVSDKKNLQGVESAAAGRTSISAWLPASWV